jgi:mevalonate kinase
LQKLLEALQVSHPKITEVLEKASAFNLQAKLTGAGGGGFVFVLLPPNTREENITELTAQLERIGMECYLTTLGTVGVQINVVS